MLLINNSFFSNLRLKYFIRQLSIFVFIYNIKNNKYLINNYL